MGAPNTPGGAPGAQFGRDAAGNITGLKGQNGILLPFNTVHPSASGIIFGDSITANAWQSFTGGVVSRTGGVVTWVSAGHPYWSGQTLISEQWSNTTINGNFVVTRVDANTLTFPAPGADFNAGTVTFGGIRGPNWRQDIGYFNHVQTLSGNIDLMWNAGVGGDTTTQMLARIDVEIAKSPGWFSIMAGINDLSGGTAVATTIGNLKTMFDKVRFARIPLFVYTVLPLALGHANAPNVSPYTVASANMRKVQEYNRFIRNYARQYPNVYLIDAHSVIVDPNSAIGVALPGMLSATDFIHPAAQGAQVIGALAAPVYNRVFGTQRRLRNGAGDNRDSNTDTTSNNFWSWFPGTNTPVNSNSATSSVSGTNVTGTPPKGFKVTTASLAAVVVSSPARTVVANGDTAGLNCRCVITPAAANDDVTIQANQNWATGTSLSKRYSFNFALDATGVAASGLKTIYVTVRYIIDGVQYNIYLMNSGSPTLPILQDIVGAVYSSAPIALPPGTTMTNIQWFIDAQFNGISASALTLDVGRFSFDEQTAEDAQRY